MIRLIFMGVWAILMTVGSGYAFHHFRRLPQTFGASSTAVLETRKTKEVNIPKIRNGTI